MIRIAGIEEESVVDGEGIRYVVFCQGCPHHCVGCHNPGSWSFDGGSLIDNEDIYISMQKNELLDGLTLSGGEPFMQVDELLPLVQKMKPRYNVWCYTGFLYEDLLKDNKRKLLEYIDVLVDGKFILEQRDLTLRFKGSKNQRLIDVQKSLKENKIILWA